MRRPSLVAGLVLTLMHLALLVFRLPWLVKTPGWFWGFEDKPFAMPVLVAAAAVASVALLTWVVRADTVNAWARLLIVFLTGAAIQHGLALSEGRGLNGMRDRIVYTGHAELVVVAVTHPNAVELIENYEQWATSGELGVFAPSKPPGMLLFYVLTDRVAQALNATSDPEERLEQVRTLAAWTWPFISMLAILPLFILSRIIARDSALAACVLFVAVPSVQLITLHTDQVLFPLVSLSSAALVALSFTKRNWALAVAAGASIYLAAFVSFPLAASGLIAAIAAEKETGSFIAPERPSWVQWAIKQPVPFLILGVLIAGWLFAALFDYDVLTRYQNALAHHSAWRTWRERPIEYIHYGLLGLTEFALWLGLPIATLTLTSVKRENLFTVALLCVLLLLAAFGKTKAEVARLWLFLMPLACIPAAQALQRLNLRLLLPAVLSLQALLVLATKRYQDFH